MTSEWFLEEFKFSSKQRDEDDGYASIIPLVARRIQEIEKEGWTIVSVSPPTHQFGAFLISAKKEQGR